MDELSSASSAAVEEVEQVEQVEVEEGGGRRRVEVEQEWPTHMRPVIEMVERQAGVRLSLPVMEACAAAGKQLGDAGCGLADVGVKPAEAGLGKADGLLYHSEVSTAAVPQ